MKGGTAFGFWCRRASLPGALIVCCGLFADPVSALWLEQTFDANLATCQERTRPAWCQEWFATLEEARPDDVGDDDPEWRRTPIARNLEICSTHWPPDWCADCLEGLRAIHDGEVYQSIVGRVVSAIEAERARLRAEHEAWRSVVDRVRQRIMTDGDVDAVEARAEAGESEALELLAWMHVQGYGVDPDFARAYELYGRAVLGGRDDLKPNLAAIWPYLNENQRKSLRDRFTGQ